MGSVVVMALKSKRTFDIGMANIDGDILLYRSAFAAEHTIYTLSWDDNEQEFDKKRSLNAFLKEHSSIMEYSIESRLEIEPLSHALSTIKATISKIITAVKPGDIKIFLTTGKNFRHDLATIKKYKGNRDNRRKPKHYQAIREYLIKYYDAIECKGVEADDELANAQTDDSVLCSIDKDLLQVPGLHYNWVTDTKLRISPDVGLLKLWCQVLTGDSTDNIPGIYKVGPITAKRKLEQDDNALHKAPVLEAVCIDMWKEYLLGDNPPSWIIDSDKEAGTILYKHWNTKDGKIMDASAEDIVNEIYRLVKVGA